MVMTPEGAHPPDFLKGPIARSVLYSVGEYPKMAELIHNKVLDIDTAIRWDSTFPMSKAEKLWLDSLGD
jgi:endonuclease I